MEAIATPSNRSKILLHIPAFHDNHSNIRSHSQQEALPLNHSHNPTRKKQDCTSSPSSQTNKNFTSNIDSIIWPHIPPPYLGEIPNKLTKSLHPFCPHFRLLVDRHMRISRIKTMNSSHKEKILDMSNITSELRSSSPTSVTDASISSPPRQRRQSQHLKTTLHPRLPKLFNWIPAFPPTKLHQHDILMARAVEAATPLSATAASWFPFTKPEVCPSYKSPSVHPTIPKRCSSFPVYRPSISNKINRQVVHVTRSTSSTVPSPAISEDTAPSPPPHILEANRNVVHMTCLSSPANQPPLSEDNLNPVDQATCPLFITAQSTSFEAINSAVDSMCPSSPNNANKAFYISLRLHSIDDTPVYIHSGSYLSDFNRIGTIQPWGLVSLTALPHMCSHRDSYALHNQPGFIATTLAPGQKWLFNSHHTPPSTRSDSEELLIQCPASCDFPTVLAWWIENLEFIVDKVYFEGWRYHPLNIEYWLGLRSETTAIIIDDYFDRCGPRIAALQAAIIPTNFPFYGRLGDAFLCIAFAFLSELSNYQQEICQCRIDNIPLSNCIVMLSSTTHCLPITSLHTAPTPEPPTYPDDTDSYTSSIDDSYDTISNWDSDNEISDEDDDASYTSCQWKHVDNMRMINEWRPPPTLSLPFPPVPPAKFPPLLNLLLPITRMYNRCQERLYYARMQSLGHYKREYLRATKHASSIHENPDKAPLLLHNHRRNCSLLPTTLYTGPRRRPPPTPCPSVTPPPRPASAPSPSSPTPSASYQRATNTVNALMRHLPLAKPLPSCTRGYRPRRALTDAVPSYTRPTTFPTPPPCQQHTKPHAVLPFPVHDTPVPPCTPPTTSLCAILLHTPGCARIPRPRLPVSPHTFVTTHTPSVHLTSPANARPSIPSLAFHCLFAMSLTLLLPLISSLLHDTHAALYTLFPQPQPPFFPSSCCAQTPAPSFSVHTLPSTGIG